MYITKVNQECFAKIPCGVAPLQIELGRYIGQAEPEKFVSTV